MPMSPHSLEIYLFKNINIDFHVSPHMYSTVQYLFIFLPALCKCVFPPLPIGFSCAGVDSVEFVIGTSLVVASVVLVVVTAASVMVVIGGTVDVISDSSKTNSEPLLSSVRCPVWVLAWFSEKSI